MRGFNLRVLRCSFVLALIGAAATFALRPAAKVDGSRTSVQQHQGNGVGSYHVDAVSVPEGGPSEQPIQTFEMNFDIAGKLAASLVEPVADPAPCLRSDEQPRTSFLELWNIEIPEEPEHLIGYSALDHCTPIFIDRGGKHSEGDLPHGFVMEGFYENTGTGGRIELNPNALMEKTEGYRAVVLCHEELHAVLERLDPTGLNQAILPADVLGKARTQLHEAGYEGAEVDDEIVPRLLTHDPDGTGLTGVAEQDRVISGAMRALLAESESDPELQRVYRQLRRSHALTHDLMSGKAGIGALIWGGGQRRSNPSGLAAPTPRFRRWMR